MVAAEPRKQLDLSTCCTWYT